MTESESIEQPCLSNDAWGPALNQLLKEAEHSVLLSVFMLSPHWRARDHIHLNLLDTLAAVTQRGVQGRCILATVQQWVTREIPNVRAALKLTEAGWKVRFMPKGRPLHEKILVIDNHKVLVGSHNISRAGATRNYDTSLLIDSAPLAKVMHWQFWQRWRAAG